MDALNMVYWKLQQDFDDAKAKAHLFDPQYVMGYMNALMAAMKMVRDAMDQVAAPQKGA